ncbi:MAG: histidine ammonia-lyase, partial [Flavobacteriales bacterium CG_4_10_14_0_8_um_filter_32_5]
MNTHHINKNWLTLKEINDLLISTKKIELSVEATEAIEKCRTYLDEKLSRHDKPIYGINT